jgi:hypothetical protein
MELPFLALTLPAMMRATIPLFCIVVSENKHLFSLTNLKYKFKKKKKRQKKVNFCHSGKSPEPQAHLTKMNSRGLQHPI